MRKIVCGVLNNGNPVILSFLLFLLAFIVRLYMVLSANVITPDGIQYIDVAKMIVSGNFQKISTHSFFSLYPFLIVAFHKVFNDWEMAGRLVSAVFGSLAIIPFFLLIRESIGHRVAVLASLFFLINPRLIEYSSDVLREPVFWFFSIAALYCAWRADTVKKSAFLALASVFVWAAAFTRLEGAVLVVIILVWMVWRFVIHAITFRNLIMMIIIFVISFPLIAFPSLFVLKKNLGKWDFGQVGEKLPRLILMHDGDRGLELTPELKDGTSYRFKAFLDMARRHQYETYLFEVLHKFIRSFHVVFFILLLFGLVKRKYVPYDKREIPFLIWTIIFFFTAYFYTAKTYYLGTRHGLLIGIPAFVWASIGFLELRERIVNFLSRGTRFFSAFSRHATGLLVAIVVLTVLPNALASSGADKFELKKAGRYLKEIGYSNSKFVGEHNLYRVAFYADAEFTSIPEKLDREAFDQLVRENKADYVMVDERTVDSYIPGLRKIIAAAELERVSLPQLENFKEYSIRVYKTRKDSERVSRFRSS